MSCNRGLLILDAFYLGWVRLTPWRTTCTIVWDESVWGLRREIFPYRGWAMRPMLRTTSDIWIKRAPAHPILNFSTNRWSLWFSSVLWSPAIQHSLCFKEGIHSAWTMMLVCVWEKQTPSWHCNASVGLCDGLPRQYFWQSDLHRRCNGLIDKAFHAEILSAGCQYDMIVTLFWLS